MKLFRHLALAVAAVLAMVAPADAQSFAGGAEAPAFLANFGGAMALADGQLIVGEGGNTMRPGRVYIHEKQGGVWTRVAALEASDGSMEDGFGSALAVSGSDMMVAGRGGVYLFTRSGSTWTETGRLEAPAGSENAAFGGALALSGDVALVGAPIANEGSGEVHLYRRAGGSWSHAATLSHEDEEGPGIFGAALALDGEIALVGAPASRETAGAVLAFRIGAGAPEALGELLPGPLSENDAFGAAVALVNGMALASAPGRSRRRRPVTWAGASAPPWPPRAPWWRWPPPGPTSAWGRW
jgi:hypothetical protein